MIIDCHTHWGIDWEQKYGHNPSEWLKILDKHNVDKAVLMCHWGLVRTDYCEADNDNVAAVARNAPNRILPFATVWPQMKKSALDEIVRCREKLGIKGLKFHPWLQGFSTSDLYFGKICELAGKLKMPIIFHDGTPCYSLPEQIGGLARRFPQTTFILGHSGILWSWRSALETAKLPNIFCCMCGPHMRALEIFCKKADPNRLLWGSDFGFGFSDPVEYRLNLIFQAKIDNEVRKKILDKNPLKLLTEE